MGAAAAAPDCASAGAGEASATSSAAGKEKAAEDQPREKEDGFFIGPNMKGRCSLGKEHRPFSFTAYQTTWKPPRAPISPESKPAPTPAEKVAFSLIRAVIAIEPAVRSL